MPEPIDIKLLSLVELKSLCYDMLVLQQQTQANINALQAEIEERLKQEKIKNEKEVA